MRNLLISLIIICGILLLYSVSYPHGSSTHINITNRAVEYLYQSDPLCVSENQLQTYLNIGTAEEDSFPRYYFHFLPRLDSPIASATCSSLEWGFTRNATCTATTVASWTRTNTHTWYDAVDHADTDQGWIHLGYILHLLEDLTSPAHTRNDPHPSVDVGRIRIGDPDPFEVVNNGRNPALPTANLITLSTPEQYFVALQGYTQRNFLAQIHVFTQISLDLKLIGKMTIISMIAEDGELHIKVQDIFYMTEIQDMLLLMTRLPGTNLMN
jgi:hypothetical protein